MRRPVGSNEVGWLVRLLLALSDRLNLMLYLDGTELPPAEETSTVQAGPLSECGWPSGHLLHVLPLLHSNIAMPHGAQQQQQQQ